MRRLLSGALILLLSLGLTASSQASQTKTTEQVLIDAVYKLVQENNLLKKRISLLEGNYNRLSISISNLQEELNSLKNSLKKSKRRKIKIREYRKIPPNAQVEVILATFRFNKGVERFIANFPHSVAGNGINLKVRPTACHRSGQTFSCNVVYTVVPYSLYPELRKLKKDAFICCVKEDRKEHKGHSGHKGHKRHKGIKENTTTTTEDRQELKTPTPKPSDSEPSKEKITTWR